MFVIFGESSISLRQRLEHPKHRTHPKFHLAGYGVDCEAILAELPDLLVIEHPARPANGFPAPRSSGFSIPHSRADPLPDQLPLELRHGCQNV